MSILLNINLFKLVRSLHNIEKHTQHCVGRRFLYFFLIFKNFFTGNTIGADTRSAKQV